MRGMLAVCLAAALALRTLAGAAAPARAAALVPTDAVHASDALVQTVQYYGYPGYGYYGRPRFYGRPRYYGPGYYGYRRFYGGPRYYGRRGYYR